MSLIRTLIDIPNAVLCWTLDRVLDLTLGKAEEFEYQGTTTPEEEA